VPEVVPEVAWTRPAWLAEAYDWIDGRLADVGQARSGPPEQVHVYPWATVLRVPTSAGELFFKAMLPPVAHEAGALAVLASLRSDLVTDVVAADRERGWMLMRDAGAQIRTLTGERLEDWERILSAYAGLQIDAVEAVDVLLAAGVPDCRTESLPPLVDAVLEDDEAVRLGRENGLTREERRNLREQYLPRFAGLCEELAALPIRDSIQHDDLHGGQVFVRDGLWRILDWGDACIAHPFASLVVPLRWLAHRRGLAEDAPELERLRDAYLEPWTTVAPRGELVCAADLARRVGCATRLLSWQRIVPHLDAPAREDYGEAVPRWFRQLLEAL
jgi:hypothetical protein